jgi:hypothetical protein
MINLPCPSPSEAQGAALGRPMIEGTKIVRRRIETAIGTFVRQLQSNGFIDGLYR